MICGFSGCGLCPGTGDVQEKWESMRVMCITPPGYGQFA